MFSNINEVWGKKDPVRQISEKISQGILPNKDPYHQIYNMPKSQKEAKEEDRPHKSSVPQPTDQNYDLASDSKYSLLSDTDLGPLNGESRLSHDDAAVPKSSPKPALKKKSRSNDSDRERKTASFDMLTSEDVEMSLTDWKSDDSESLTMSSASAIEHKKCSKVAHHLKKCHRCSKKLKKLINNKLNNKYKDFLINKHINQPRLEQPNLTLAAPHPTQSAFNDSFKETLLIVVGAIIIIFVLFLIAKTFSK